MDISTEDSGSHFWLRLNSPRPFSGYEHGLSLQRAVGGVAKAVEFDAKQQYERRASFDDQVELLEDTDHILEVEPEISYDYDSDATIQTGMLGEIMVVGSGLETDSEYEYCEECQTFVKVLPTHRLDTLYDSYVEDIATEAVNAYLGAEGSVIYSEMVAPFTSAQKAEVKSFRVFMSREQVALAGVEMNQKLATEQISRFWQLHRAFNHPSTCFALFCKTACQRHEFPADVSRAVIELDCPRCLKTRRHNRTPERPTVSVPASTSPGELAGMDNGYFDSPGGKCVGMVHVDSFSLKLSGGASDDVKPTGEQLVRVFVENIMSSPDLLVDLEGCYDSKVFQDFL